MSGSSLSFATLRDWARAQAWLSSTYRLLPMALRQRLSQAMVKRIMRSARFPRLPVAAVQQLRARERASAAGSCTYGCGVNLFGYFRGQFGLAEAARSYAGALLQAGYPVALIDIDIDLPHGFDDRRLDTELGEEAPYPISIVFVNPDFLTAALDRIGAARLQGRYLLACWFWELERVPDQWLRAIDQVDEIMVASDFVGRAFSAATRKAVFKVPLPLSDPRDSGMQRSDFGLSQADFIFLTSFDFHSWVQRKNPLGAIEAFIGAFPDPATEVKLLVKTSNGARHPQAFAELLGAARRDRRILVRDAVLDSEHMGALQRCCDAYVSLHRAEGFGLGMAECMALGKPVIATAWSGNMEFMTSENSCLVGYRMMDVPQDGYLHGGGQQWADPAISEASDWMQRLASDPSLAGRIGERAAIDISRALSPERAAALMIERLGQLMESRNDALLAQGSGVGKQGAASSRIVALSENLAGGANARTIAAAGELAEEQGHAALLTGKIAVGERLAASLEIRLDDAHGPATGLKASNLSLTHDAATLQARLAELQAVQAVQVDRFQAHAEWLVATVDAREQEILQERAQAHRWWVTAEELRRELDAIHASRSWRITAPLRGIRQVLMQPLPSVKDALRPVLVWTMKRIVATPAIRASAQRVLVSMPGVRTRLRALAVHTGVIPGETVLPLPWASVETSQPEPPGMTPGARKIHAQLERALRQKGI